MIDLNKLDEDITNLLENETEEELNDWLKKERNKILKESKPIPSDISKLINENFWELLE